MWIDQRGSEVLSKPECLRLLALAARRLEVGRLAYCVPGERAPVIQPVNFVYRDQSVLVALGAGSVADAASRGPISFEVDGFESSKNEAWSVLVRGFAVPFKGAQIAVSQEFWPRPLVPRPGRQIFVIRIDVVTGRRFVIGEPALT